MDITAIFKAQTELKATIEQAVDDFQVAHPEVTKVTMSQDYTPVGEVVRLVVIIDHEGESITRKV